MPRLKEPGKSCLYAAITDERHSDFAILCSSNDAVGTVSEPLGPSRYPDGISARFKI